MNNNNFMMSPMNAMYSKPMPVSAGKVYPADQPMVFNSQNPNAPPIYPCGICHKEVSLSLLLRENTVMYGVSIDATFQVKLKYAHCKNVQIYASSSH